MRRHLLGLIALLLLGGAVYFFFRPPKPGMEEIVYAGCLRMGLLLVVFWAAYHQVMRLPPIVLGTFPILIAILVFRPKWLLIAIPIVIVLAVLKPRKPPKS